MTRTSFWWCSRSSSRAFPRALKPVWTCCRPCAPPPVPSTAPANFRRSVRSPFQGKIKNVLKCIRCGNRGNIRISSFDNLTLSLQKKLAVNDLLGLLRVHFSNEIVENVFCGFCSWSDFKSQISGALENLRRKNGQKSEKQLTRTKSEEKFRMVKPNKKMTRAEILETILKELDKMSKYDIKEVDRLGKSDSNTRNDHRQFTHQVRTQKREPISIARGLRRSQHRISESQNNSGEAEANHRISADSGSAPEPGCVHFLGLPTETQQFD